MTKFLSKTISVAVFWGLYILCKGYEPELLTKLATLGFIFYMHWGILTTIDVIFERKETMNSKEVVDVGDRKFVVVWSDDSKSDTCLAIKRFIKKLSSEYGVEVTHAWGDKLEFCTDKVYVKFVTKTAEYQGLKYDKAFGFNSGLYIKPLLDYILEVHEVEVSDND